MNTEIIVLPKGEAGKVRLAFQPDRICALIPPEPTDEELALFASMLSYPPNQEGWNGTLVVPSHLAARFAGFARRVYRLQGGRWEVIRLEVSND